MQTTATYTKLRDQSWGVRVASSILPAAGSTVSVAKRDGSVKYRIGHVEAFHIIQSFSYDEVVETYTFALDPRWASLFSNREFALIDWAKRLQIGRGQDMAKALQRLVATSSDTVQRYALDWLKDKMQYQGRMRDFRGALAKAVRELERLEIVSRSRVEQSTKGKEQLVMYKSPDAT